MLRPFSSHMRQQFINIVPAMVFFSILAISYPAAAATQNFAFLAQITRRQYPHAHAVLALEKETITYAANGTSRAEDEVFLTILDEQGKQEHGVLSFQVNRSYAKLDIPLLEIIKPDGRLLSVDFEKNSREDTSTRNSRMNIYNPNQRTINIFLPGLEIGDTIHYLTRQERFKTIIPDQMYGMVLGQYLFPIRTYHFTLKGPASLPINHLIKDEVAGCVSYHEEKEKNLVIRNWTFKDVPPVVPEPSMPPLRQVAMRLLFSSLDSWEQISRWYHELVEPKLKPTPEMTEMVATLTAGKHTAEEKITAVYYFVAQQVRYMGITTETDRPGFEPHDVGLTFSRRHGVCRDKAALLVSMLRLAGFAANPVLISLDEKLDREIPLPYFNHAITVASNSKGEPAWFMDPTSETSRQLLPDYERDASYLIADQQGTSLSLIPPVLPEENRFSLHINDRIQPDNSLAGTITATCRGFADTAMRSLLMRRSREEQKDFLEQMILRRRPEIKVTNLNWSDPADRATLFTFSCSFSLPDAIRWLDQQRGIFLPASNMADPGILDRWILGKADMTTRSYPLRLGYTYSTVVEEQIAANPLLQQLELPPATAIDTKYFNYQTLYVGKGEEQLTITRTFALKQLEVPAASYQEITSLQHDRNQEVLLPILITRKP
ncbi:MAG: DUF3857 and transglutaminase domain-containing protein [Deltaproteobacteria bacterium]|nr:DUF3857 and transglutaminase domain-containing protein [Candidatus Anaeroferrophillus wilburensis]MBN2888940.1 DUF3857 and transglutaminase domain-containing protein [Deltaproteobacteria bacterium]